MNIENPIQITASHLLEYIFCPRFSYFEHVLGIQQQEDKRFKVMKGRQIHEKVRKMNPDYLRKKIGVRDKKSDMYLSGNRGLYGIVDEILFLEDGTASPLDYKYAEYKDITFKNHRYQLALYGTLIIDNYNVPVNKGFIVYTKSKNKLVEIPLTEKEYQQLDNIVTKMIDVIQNCKYPEPTRYKRRCPDCCYKNICESTI